MSGLRPELLSILGLSLWMWGLFSIKHLVADYLLQNQWMVQNKGTYYHPAGWAHAGIHGALSALVLGLIWWFCPISVELKTIFVMTTIWVAGEIVIHHLIDVLKVALTKRLGLSPKDWAFWAAFGVDQLLHGLTYIAISAWFWKVVIESVPAGRIFQF
jgi:hypothetical protein